ncbi:spore maturation protein CgeB [Algoriphagus ratkowskyi]|uniref:Glycosyltransferase n=1 Tax=Algoriphagus ratkowskyi TaxID=57028 RepID=A0A2W7RR36_9BACT|nr:glycosyltransferase [Algoriphagus ratkowskyi]PZX57807.1 spore maturation protein CgeB [Algoriphagus ratkowskyi]TXD79071.1 glycosyltransferase [Algoriphagus ratkowskyi]
MKTLCIGPIWRGSNAGGLFKAMARQGVLIEVVDEFYYIPLSPVTLKAKIISKLARKLYINDYNEAIIDAFNKITPDYVFVYKGAFIYPKTLEFIKNKNIPIFNFYPDVSIHTHGNLLKDSMRLYDKIFTTKSFGKDDYIKQLGVEKVVFIPHGFDPEIHRPVSFENIPKSFFCDVSFIGTFSPKKEAILAQIVEKMPSVNFKIWGTQWEKSSKSILKSKIQDQGIFGDLYAAAINGSKINLGILSERVGGASSGDLITSRTFHIPGAGGFLIHEKNHESVKYFQEGVEADFFESAEDLADKILFYLNNESKRDQIRNAGFIRAQKEHSLDCRAKLLLENFN